MLEHGNRVFQTTGGHGGLTIMPRERLIVIGCADPRVDPEKILGLHLGDAAVIRNIGGRITPPTLATISGLAKVGSLVPQPTAQRAQKGMDILVLQHTDCGILRLADEPGALAHFLGSDPSHLADMHVTDVHAAVAYDVAALRSLNLPGIRVWGSVYDVVTGAVEFTETPEEARA